MKWFIGTLAVLAVALVLVCGGHAQEAPELDPVLAVWSGDHAPVAKVAQNDQQRFFLVVSKHINAETASAIKAELFPPADPEDKAAATAAAKDIAREQLKAAGLTDEEIAEKLAGFE